MLFEMLAGEPPFVSEGLGDLMDMHMNRPAPRLRARVPGVPEHIDAAVARALEKTPADRFATAAEFQAYLRGGPARTLPVLNEAHGSLRGATLDDSASREPISPAGGARGGDVIRLRTKNRKKLAIVGGCFGIALALYLVWIEAGVKPEPATFAATAPPAPRAPQPETPSRKADAAQAANVTITVKSIPAQATVFDTRSQESLGETPVALARSPRTNLELRITKSGWRPATIPVEFLLNDTKTVELTRIPKKPLRTPSPTEGLQDL